MSQKIQRFLAENQPDTPCLVVDLDVVSKHYQRLSQELPGVEIFYAVKANPAEEILTTLRDLGSKFDAASIYEIEQCLALEIAPDRLSFGHTIKKERHIGQAFDAGVRQFAFDSLEELQKLSRAAPGASVFCRFLTSNDGADWPLSDKFGCNPDFVPELLCRAAELGLAPTGISFHVGSQQRDPATWDAALSVAARIFSDAKERGIKLSMLNIGGGFPSHYRAPKQELAVHTNAIKRGLQKHFADFVPKVIVEPGRYIPGDAGIIQSEVVLISRKSPDAQKRWVYLDIGKFGGLPEVLDEAIQYRLRTPQDGGQTGPVILAGPTCDEVDVIYDAAGYELPLDLAVGDLVEILSAGAYTASYSSVGFNGFPPLKEYYI